MDLECWRAQRKITYRELADLIGVSQAAMARRYALGEQWPRSETVERIFRATDGNVTPTDLHCTRIAWLTEAGLFHPDTLPPQVMTVTEILDSQTSRQREVADA